eukprot:1139151-Pelagomonas_calceolata.AAC.1
MHQRKSDLHHRHPLRYLAPAAPWTPALSMPAPWNAEASASAPWALGPAPCSPRRWSSTESPQPCSLPKLEARHYRCPSPGLP